VFKERVQKYKSKLALSLQVQFLLVTQSFSLSRARDMLITSFLISSPLLKFTIILYLSHVSLPYAEKILITIIVDLGEEPVILALHPPVRQGLDASFQTSLPPPRYFKN